jgi:uncharacterized membrane protein
MKRLFSLLKNELVTGLLLMAPVAGAAWLAYWLVTTVDGLFPNTLRPTIEGVPIPGLGLLTVLVVGLVVGLLARNFVGRQLVAFIDNVAHRIPLVGTTYGLIKQVLEAVFSTGGGSFQRAVLVQYPAAGSWAIAFVTAESPVGRVADAVGPDVISVYVPTTPNPTSGFYLLVERSATRALDMPVEQAFKLILTMGIADAESLATTARWSRPPNAPGAVDKPAQPPADKPAAH